MDLTLQVGFENLLLMLPLLLCCVLMPMLQRKGQAAGGGVLEVDVWYTPENIDETFNAISQGTEEWKKETLQRPTGFSLYGGAVSDKFDVIESVSPRLIKMKSRRSGAASFELTEALGGGTSVKASYSPRVKARIQVLKATLPLKSLVAKSCGACGKPIFVDYLFCPYCGSKMEAETV